jgi:aminopeptidase N
MLRALIVVLLLAVAAPVRAALPVLDFEVRIDPDTRAFAGRGSVVVPAGNARELVLRRDFSVDSLMLNGRPLAPLARTQGDVQAWRLPSSRAEQRVEIAWRGTLAPLDPSIGHRQTLGRTAPATGKEGTFLPSSALWHPAVAGTLTAYRIVIDLPEGQRGVVPGRLVDERAAEGRYRARFEFPHPADGIDLMAGPYRVESRAMRGIQGRDIALRTYFHPPIAELSAGYLESSKGFIDYYERTIGPYAYSEFSVVSSPTPTGFGMPTLTYLGMEVLRLPFIRQTSLGHEVLHNWWGNGVFPDYATGNWSEGLTTFMADYAFKERESEAAARAMRLEWLRDFAAVPPGQDKPLVAFTSRTHGTSQIVGYNKAAMVFFMLRDRIGREAFERSLREFWSSHRFKVASWTDLRRAFEQVSGLQLGTFFNQWLTRSGAPALRIERAVPRTQGDTYVVDVTLAQSAPAYALNVPLVFRTPRGDDTRWVAFDGERQSYSFTLELQPTAVLLDPDLHVFRRLAPDEAPPILRQVMLDPATVTVIASDGDAAAPARELAQRVQDHAPKFLPAQSAPTRAPALVIGLASDVDRWLQRNGFAGRPEAVGEKGTAQVWTQARSEGAPLVIVSARDVEALRALLRPLPHYGRQSYLAFDGSRVLDRGVWPSQPVSVPLR